MRVLLAPFEVAGQSQILASGLKARNIKATTLDFRTNPNIFGFKTDRQIPIKKYKGRSQTLKKLEVLAWALLNYSTFHFTFGQTLDLDNHRDLPVLKFFRKKLIMHFHGSDIRNYKWVIERAVSFQKKNKEPLSTLEQQKNINYLSKYIDLFLVSTPDLINIVRQRTSRRVVYFPNSTIIKRYNAKNGSKNEETVILHSPTKRELKGTKYILSAVERLKKKAIKIKFLLIENTPQRELMNLYQQADIVVDQLFIGWYGLNSIEGMAHSKPVLCYVDPELRKTYAPDLPILNVTPRTLEEELLKLIQDKEKQNRVGSLGLQYVKKYHDVTQNIERLLELYETL